MFDHNTTNLGTPIASPVLTGCPFGVNLLKLLTAGLPNYRKFEIHEMEKKIKILKNQSINQSISLLRNTNSTIEVIKM